MIIRVLLMALVLFGSATAAKWYYKGGCAGTHVGTQANPFDHLDSTQVAGKLTAGDTVYCCSTYTMGATPSTWGSTASIKYWGTNASWTMDGTKCVLNAAATANYCIDIGAINYIEIYNFEFKNALKSNVKIGAGDYLRFKNVSSHDADSCGFWGASGSTQFTLDSCQIYNNDTAGVWNPGQAMYISGCNIYSNKWGIYAASLSGDIRDCLIYSNKIGIRCSGTFIDGCTISGLGVESDTGIHCSAASNFIKNCRISSFTTGLVNGNYQTIIDGNLFARNADDTATVSNLYMTRGRNYSDNNLWAQTDPGYADTTASPPDFSTKIDASMVFQERIFPQ